MAGAARTYPPLDLDALRTAVSAGRTVRVGVLPTGQFPDGTAGRVRTVGAPEVDGPEFIQVELVISGARDVIPFAPADLSPLRRGQSAPEPVVRAAPARRRRRAVTEPAAPGPGLTGSGTPAVGTRVAGTRVADSRVTGTTAADPTAQPPLHRADASTATTTARATATSRTSGLTLVPPPPAGVPTVVAGSTARRGGSDTPATRAGSVDRSTGLFETDAHQPVRTALTSAAPTPARTRRTAASSPTRSTPDPDQQACAPAAAGTPTTTAPAAAGAPTSTAPDGAGAPAGPRRSAERGKRQRITVTLSTAEPDHTAWTVQVTVGSRTVVKPSTVPPAQAWTVVTGLGHPEVEKFVAGALAEHRRQTQDRADRLARELAEAQAELAGYPDV